MKCVDAEQLFDAYLDGELTGSLRLELDAHRLKCRHCQQALAMLETCADVIRQDVEVPAMSADFTAGVMQQVEDRRPALPFHRRRKTMFVVGLLANAAALLLAVYWYPAWQAAPTDPMQAESANVDWEVVFTPYRRIMALASDNLAGDMGRMVEYTTHLSVPEDLALREPVGSPLQEFINALLPPPTDEPESTVGDAETYAL